MGRKGRTSSNASELQKWPKISKKEDTLWSTDERQLKRSRSSTNNSEWTSGSPQKRRNGQNLCPSFEAHPRSRPEWTREEEEATLLPVIDDSGAVRRKKLGADDRAISNKNKRRIQRMEKELAKKEKKREQQKAETPEERKIMSAVEAVTRLRGRPEERMGILQMTLAHTSEKVQSEPEAAICYMEVFWLLIEHFEGCRRRHEGRAKSPQLAAKERDAERELANQQTVCISLILVAAATTVANILPGYRVLEDDGTAADSEQLKKTTRALLKHERQLLREYRRLLSFLENQTFHRLFPRVLAAACCTVLRSSPTFNDACRLVVPIANFATLRGAGKEVIGKMCLDCLFEIFERDTTLETTEAIVTAIYNITNNARSSKKNAGKKGGTVRLSGKLLAVLGQIDIASKERLATMDIERQQLSDRHIRNKDKEKVRQLLKATITGNLEAVRKREARIIEMLFMVYVRVLTSPHLHPLPVVEAALRGIGNHAATTNISLNEELLELLKRILTELNPAPGVALLAIGAALRLLATIAVDISVEASWVSSSFMEMSASALPLLIKGFTATEKAFQQPRITDVLDGSLEELKSKSVICRPPAEEAESEEEEFDDEEAVIGISAKNIQTFQHTSLQSSFFIEYLKTCDLLLSSPVMVGETAAASHTAGVLAVVVDVFSELVNLGLHAEPRIGDNLFLMAVELLRKYPKLRNAIDTDGIILHDNEEKSLYWSLTLAESSLLASKRSREILTEMTRRFGDAAMRRTLNARLALAPSVESHALL